MTDAVKRTSFGFERLWTPVEAGEYLVVHWKTVNRMAREGELPGLRLGKHWRFRAVDLTDWAARQVKSTRQPAASDGAA